MKHHVGELLADVVATALIMIEVRLAGMALTSATRMRHATMLAGDTYIVNIAWLPLWL